MGYGETIPQDELIRILDVQDIQAVGLIKDGNLEDRGHQVGDIPPIRFREINQLGPLQKISAADKQEIYQRASELIPSALSFLKVDNKALRDALIYDIVLTAADFVIEQDLHRNVTSKSEQRKSIKKLIDAIDRLVDARNTLSQENLNHMSGFLDMLAGPSESPYRNNLDVIHLIDDAFDKLSLLHRICLVQLAAMSEPSFLDRRESPALRKGLVDQCAQQYFLVFGKLPIKSTERNFQAYASLVFEIAADARDASLSGSIERVVAKFRKRIRKIKADGPVEYEKIDGSNIEKMFSDLLQEQISEIQKDPAVHPDDKRLLDLALNQIAEEGVIPRSIRVQKANAKMDVKNLHHPTVSRRGGG